MVEQARDLNATGLPPALFPHQVDIINAARGKRYFAIFADCGTGKTRCAIELMRQASGSILIIAPNTILENWAEEIKHWSNLTYIILQGSKAKRLQLLNKLVDVYIINYEALRILEPELAAMNFNMIIADEIQKLKGHRSLQSKAAFRLSQRIQYRLGLTGTPIINNLCDVFAEYRFLNPFIFGFSFYRFRNRYCVMGGYMNKEIKGYVNVEELQDKVHSIAIRVRKEDCLKLPDKVYQTHSVDLSPEQKRVYNELKKEFIAELKGKVVTAPYILTRITRLSQCTAGFVKTEDSEEINFDTNPKLRWLREFIEDLPKDEKVVIFFRFIKELKNLRAMFNDMGISFVEVYGETKDRQDKINAFNKGPAQIFCCQLQTAGLGVNLHSARYCVFLSNSYSWGDRLQAEDRLHRIGQTRNVVYLDIIARQTIDETILKCLKSKKDLAESIMEEVNMESEDK